MTLVGHVADTKRRLQFVVGGETAKNGRKYRVLSRNRAWRESRDSLLPFLLCENSILMTHIQVGSGALEGAIVRFEVRPKDSCRPGSNCSLAPRTLHPRPCLLISA
jgi:hypothetical protein